MESKISYPILIIPIAAALLSVSHHQPPAKIQSKYATHHREAQSEPLAANYIEGDVLSYAGFIVRRSFDPQTRLSSATIMRAGKQLAKFSNGGLGKESTKFGLFPFLGRGSKQLVIMQYTGGVHCCWIYRIFELTPNIRPLFDGEDYGIDSIGYELNPIDIDRDGRFEFTQSVMTFDYFYLSHASSIFPTAVFAYDLRQRKYLPANRRYSDYILKDIGKDSENARRIAATINHGANLWGKEKYLSATLKVVTKFIYAGKEKAGWEFYDREYVLNDKTEIRSALRKSLDSDPFYQALRLQPSRRRPSR